MKMKKLNIYIIGLLTLMLCGNYYVVHNIIIHMLRSHLCWLPTLILCI